jgi:hypothetical protein
MRIKKPLPTPTREELAMIERIRSIERAELDALVRASEESGATQALQDAMKFAQGTVQAMRPLLFLDFDDVICVNAPYGGYDVFTPDPPADLYEKLWHPPAAQTLLAIMSEHNPVVVVTTSWLKLMDRGGFEALFRRTGLHAVADSLHPAWEAPPGQDSRLAAIEEWLIAHYAGEPFAALDDKRSGTGLPGSWLERAGCLVLCEENVGLHSGHLPAVRAALTSKHAIRAVHAEIAAQLREGRRTLVDDDFEPVTDEQYEAIKEAAPDASGTVLSTLLGNRDGA